MQHKKLVILLVGLVFVGVLVRPSCAAPAVKRLGMSNTGSNVQSNTVATPKAATKATTSNTQRAPSVRLVGSSAKVAPKQVGGTSVLNTKTTNTADVQRLSAIGKNLVKTKVVPGTGYSSTPQTAGVENTELMKRVTDLENKMGQISDLPEKVAEIDTQISDLNEKVDVANLSSNYYTIGQTQEYLEENYYTKAYVDQIVSQISGANVVNQFDPSFLHQD